MGVVVVRRPILVVLLLLFLQKPTPSSSSSRRFAAIAVASPPSPAFSPPLPLPASSSAHKNDHQELGVGGHSNEVSSSEEGSVVSNVGGVFDDEKRKIYTGPNPLHNR
ncbi:unnamed protein product [Linum trigynum]|uniref:Uncharacterized protein n=1 Tax=Linum trigynum TaxID=586398 RepID=A0AAV2FZY1_9ROSI